MKRISNEEIKIMQFRRAKLLEQTAELELLISGRKQSVLPYIHRENGKYSEERTWSFIDRLIECLERYLQCEHEEVDFEFCKEERDFYKSFLYCTIRGEAFDLPDMEIMVKCKTIDDILKMAEHPETTRIQRDVDLFFEETYEPVTGGFFGYMDEVYKVLTGNDITAAISKEDYERMKQIVPGRIGEKEESVTDYERQIKNSLYENGMTEAETDAYLNEQDIETAEQMWEEAREYMAEEQAYFNRSEAEKKTFADSFENKETFIEQYLQYRKLYFQVEHRKLPQNIEGMIEIFLYDEELSNYGKEDNFLTAYTLLSRTINQIKKLI